MKKLLTALCLAAAFSAPAQTLFTYGKESVAADDFLRAFKKNNSGSVSEKGLNEYLQLYIGARLKVTEAKSLRYDTLPQLVADLANLRQQIMPAYLTDKESMDRMIGEAFNRSQKDLHIAHIFIRGGENAAAAEKKKTAVMQALASGDFATVAKQYSDDPSAKNNGGDLGWITAFSLPYELENLAYNTPDGKISPAYQSRAGYHIFKNLGSRKAIGRLKAAQILLAVQPTSGAAEKAILKRRADSLYKRLLAGNDFGKLATAFSNDVISAASNGQMAEFGVGDYDPVFENAVWRLLKDGDITSPFLTEHGYHLVKRLKVLPVSATLTDETREAIRKRVEQSDRMQFSKDALAQKVLKTAGYRKLKFSDAELQAYTDSILTYQVPQIKVSLKPETALLTIGNQSVTANDWTAFAQTARFKQDGSGAKPHAQVWDEFVQATALSYYQDHLEDFNEEFRRQITEFADGNLFFEIMQRQVWTPAQTDSAGLVAYFQQHKKEYNWKESADAVVFYSAENATAKEVHKALHKNLSAWRTILMKYAEQVTADSNRFELAQLPRTEKQRLAAGMLTTPSVNKDDNTTSFAYIIKLHPEAEPRNFTEAKGLVINDYQAQLEKEWIEKLKEKYPVEVNEKVWSDLVKKASSE